jgi:hypothetical protein
MLAIVVANVVLDLLAVGAVAILLSWGIVMDKRALTSQSSPRSDAGREKTTQAALPRLGTAVRVGA